MVNHKEKLDDVEAQVKTQPSPPGSPGMVSEYRVSTWTKLGHLALYFLCNVALTLYNKMILGTVDYPRTPRHQVMTADVPSSNTHGSLQQYTQGQRPWDASVS